MRRILSLLLGLGLALTACNGPGSTGPVEIKLDRDPCHKCGMVISEKRFAAEVQGGPDHKVFKFDDLGCALSWLKGQSWAGDADVKLWVTEPGTGQWIDARSARFESGKTTPMAFGWAPAASGGVGLEEVQRNLASGGHAK